MGAANLQRGLRDGEGGVGPTTDPITTTPFQALPYTSNTDQLAKYIPGSLSNTTKSNIYGSPVRNISTAFTGCSFEAHLIL